MSADDKIESEDMAKAKRIKLDPDCPVQSLRDQLDLTHTDIGDAAGVSKATAQGYVTDDVRVSTLARIVSGLGYKLYIEVTK